MKKQKIISGLLTVAAILTAAPAVNVNADSFHTVCESGKYVYQSNYNNKVTVYTKAGNKKKSYKLVKLGRNTPAALGDIYMTGSYMYYYQYPDKKVDENASKKVTVYQVPIDKKTGHIYGKKIKKLFKAGDAEEFQFLYANKKKIIYSQGSRIVSVDLNKKKKQYLAKTNRKGYRVSIACDSTGKSVKIGNYIYYTCYDFKETKLQSEEVTGKPGKNRFYQLDVKKGKIKKIAENISIASSTEQRPLQKNFTCFTNVAVSGKKIYIVTKDAILCYDSSKKTLKKVIASTVMQKCFEQQGLQDIKEWDTLCMMIYKGRLYVESLLKYDYEQKKEADNTPYPCYNKRSMVVSVSLKNLSALRYEKELSGFLVDKNKRDYQQKTKEALVYDLTFKSGTFLTMERNGKCIGEFFDEDGKLMYYSYDIKTGIVKKYSSAKAKAKKIAKGINDWYQPNYLYNPYEDEL